MKQSNKPSKDAGGVLICFFISGAAGLVYQVAWGKALGLIFGHTIYAVTIVLAVFMAGLGAGSAWWGKKFQTQQRDALKVYAWLEILVGVTGVLSLAGLAAVRAIYVFAAPSFEGSPGLLLLLRLTGSAVVLFIPTFLMGGTFPILVHGLTQSSAEFGDRVSVLYWVNTIGAVSGALLSGFFLLPTIGLKSTIVIAAILNVLAGSFALRVRKSFLHRSDAATGRSLPSGVKVQKSQVPARLMLLALAITGATSFGYEVAWTRLLSIAVSSSTYAFTLMLATFLTGIVAGSMLFQRFSRERSCTLSSFGWTQTFVAAAGVASLFFFRWIPALVPPMLRITHESFWGLVSAQALTSVLVMLPIASAFGFSFPLALSLLASSGTSGDQTARTVGRGYATNTMGAILGALIVGFWLVPWVGGYRAIAAIAACNLVLAFVIAFYLRPAV